MGPFRRYAVVLLGSAAACVWSGAGVNAGELLFSPQPIAEQDQMLPAVSGVNGKWELGGGLLSPGGGGLHAAGSITAPIGDRLGAQGDIVAVLTGSGGLYFAGAGHLFTRDPSSYLAGVTAGVVVAPGANIGAVGVESEFYMDRLSLESWFGLAGVNYAAPALTDRMGLFGFGDLAYYPTDNLRFTVGGSYVLGDGALHVGAEYQLDNPAWPMSLTGDAKLHASGNYSLTVGLRGYFGGDDSKSLIDRHRQDDPRNRALDLFNGSSGVLSAKAPGSSPPALDGEAACEAEQGANEPYYGDGLDGIGYYYWDSFYEKCYLD